MSIQESAIKEVKPSILALVRAFSSLVHFWRGEWFVWTGTHYEQVAQQGIAQWAMAFLEQKSTSPVNGSLIRRFVDLLQIIRYADHPTVPCWSTPGACPRRRSCLPSITGYCTLRPPPRAVQNFCPTTRRSLAYRRCPTIIVQQPVVLVGGDSWINCGAMRRRRSNCCKSGLGIVYCRIHLSRRSWRSTGP